MAKIIDGKGLAGELEEKIKAKIAKLGKICLATVVVGEEPASQTYVKKKEEACKRVGIEFRIERFKEDATEREIIRKIEELNRDKEITGILVQLPLPKNINSERIINLVSPKKDVDGLTKANMQNLENGDERLVCCTPKGIIRLLEENKIDLRDKKVVIVGYGRLVGKPLSLMLKNRKIDFSICDDKTINLKENTKKADVLISAVGVPNLIREEHVKKGAVIIDAGFTKLNGKVAGDVDFDGVKEKASFITPKIGGVGPMTIVMLLENLISAKMLLNRIG